MSLQVWLPLNGDINNQGLSNITFSAISTNTSSNANGKIGSCYVNNSFASGGLISNNTISLGTKQSMFCWVKFTSLYSSSSLGGGLVSQHRHQSNRGMGLTIKYVSSTTGYLSVNTGNGSSRTYNTYCATTLMTAGTWYHVGYTYDGANIRLYVNGVLEATHAYANMSVPADYIMLFCWSLSGTSGNGVHGDYKLNGYLNDVRIYDHCLSPKEVKEISKGLCLHYKLGGVGGENLLINTDFTDKYTVTGWDVSKNGNYNASSWGGYNSGVANPSTVYHAHLQQYDNGWVYNYHRDANNSWLGIAQVIAGKLQNGKTYTFSAEWKRISGTTYPTGGLYCKASSSATGNSFVNWYAFSGFARITDDKWHRYTYTFTVPDTAQVQSGASCYWYIYGHEGVGEILMRKPKIEEGSVATPWCPAPSDALYTQLGFANNIEYDLSGFKNNGTKKTTNRENLWPTASTPFSVGTPTKVPTITKDGTGYGFSIANGTGFTVRTQSLGFNGYAGPWCISFDAYATANTNLTLDICDQGIKTISITTVKQRFYIVATATNYYTASSYNGFWDLAGTVSGTVYISNIKMEKGRNMTPFSNAVIGPTWDNNTPRYSGSYKFGQGTDFIESGFSLPMSQASCSFWIKPVATDGGYSTVVSSKENSGGIWLGVNTEGSGIWFYNGQYFRGVPMLTNNVWHHVVFVFDGGNVKTYINGELKSSGTVTNTTQMNTNNLCVGNSYSGSSWATNFDGNMSDFRLFATALSAADIKELYETSAIATNSGVAMAYELVEE